VISWPVVALMSPGEMSAGAVTALSAPVVVTLTSATPVALVSSAWARLCASSVMSAPALVRTGAATPAIAGAAEFVSGPPELTLVAGAAVMTTGADWTTGAA
jgi:hypothetical protein